MKVQNFWKNMILELIIINSCRKQLFKLKNDEKKLFHAQFLDNF